MVTAQPTLSKMLLVLLAAHFICLAQSLEHQYISRIKSYMSYEAKVYEKVGEYLTECGSGEYLNLCGECVSGKTEKDDDFGKDSCGICGGLETCKNKCSDGMDILDAYEDPGGCTKFVSMSSNVQDLAESANGSVSIFGDGISPASVADVDCALRKGEVSVVDTNAQVLEGKIELFFPLPGEGSYDLVCNTSLGIDFRQQVTVVDSRNLQPTAIETDSIVTWVENQVTVKVSRLTGPTDLLCFARADSGELLYRGWTSAVYGNSLSSTVNCPGFVALRPGPINFGVTYSSAAIDSVKTWTLSGVAEAPTPMKTVFKPEKSEIVVTFNQNLEDVKDCESVFDSATILLLGQSPSCYSVANEIHVLMQGGVSLKDMTLPFKDESVRTKFSKAAWGGSVFVAMASVRTRTQSSLQLEGSRKVCSGQQGRLVLSSDRQTMGPPVWVVAGSNLSNISVGQRQRLNLLAWRAARASKRDPKALLINSTMMSPGVTYRVKATANDSTGTQSEVSAEVSLLGSNETWMSLDGPTVTDVREYVFFQAALHSCGPSQLHIKFKWEVSSDKDRLDTYFVNGPVLRLDPGYLMPDSVYNLTVEALDGEQILASESRELYTFLENFSIRLRDFKIVTDNGHSIEIDASKALDINSKTIKINWTCKKGNCYVAGKERTPLNSLETFTQTVLRLPAKTLAVGRYLFGLEVTSDGRKLGEAEVEVLVVSGEPPHISALAVQEGKLEYVFHVDVSEVRQKCKFFWSILPQLGYDYIAIEQKPISIEGLPTQPKSAHMKLSILKESLTSGSKFLLKASADCGRAAQSYRIFKYFVADGFLDSRLEVEPAEGHALETEFVYRLVEKRARPGAVYFFGYQHDGLIKPLYSGRSKEFRTYFGCCNVTTVARVCRSRTNCFNVYGPVVLTSQPEHVNASISRSMANAFEDQVMSSNYEEALSQLNMVLPVLKNMDNDSYEQFSQDVQKIIVERIHIYTERLKLDRKCLQDAVKMLDATSDVIALVQVSEETMATVLSFRDLVHASAKSVNEKLTEKKISKYLPPEPRPSVGNEFTIRRKRSLKESEERTPLVAARNALGSVIKYTQQLGDNSNASRKERSKLLDSIVYYSVQFMQNVGLHQVAEPTQKKISTDNFSPSVQLNPQRFKRAAGGGIEDHTKDTIKKIDAVLKATALSLKNMANGTDSALKEMRNLIGYTMEYSEDLCNVVKKFEIVGSGHETIRLGVAPLKADEKEKAKFPFCSSVCPNEAEVLNVSVANYNAPTKSPEGVCIAVASLSDDILTTLFSLNSTVNRSSNLYWLNVMRYEHGVVVNKTFNVNSTANQPEGMAVIQFPLWSVPEYRKIKLECRVFSPTGWNNTACVKLKEILDDRVTSVQCQCPFPGFYSVFAVDNDGTNQTASAQDRTTTQRTSPPTTASTTPTLATTKTALVIPTTAVISKSTNASHDAVATTQISKTSSSPSTMTTESEQNATVPTNKNSTNTIANSSVATPVTTISGVTLNYDVRTVPSVFQPYKYAATFRINENYTQEVGGMKEKFEEYIEDQLQNNFNLSESVTIDVHEDEAKITVTLRIPENKIQEAGPAIAALREHLKNGTLLLKGLCNNRQLSIPSQDIVLTQNSNAKSAITAVVTIIFIFLIILIGSVLAAFYLRNSREQRSLRITQDLHPDPPAPRYLRLHDSVSLDSGPSSPQNPEMESSLAVLTRPQRRGYETMETFSHFPGNI